MERRDDCFYTVMRQCGRCERARDVDKRLRNNTAARVHVCILLHRSPAHRRPSSAFFVDDSYRLRRPVSTDFGRHAVKRTKHAPPPHTHTHPTIDVYFGNPSKLQTGQVQKSYYFSYTWIIKQIIKTTILSSTKIKK